MRASLPVRKFWSRCPPPRPWREIAATWRCAASESSSSGLETPISYYVQSETLPRARPGHPRLEAAPILNEQDVDARNKSGHGAGASRELGRGRPPALTRGSAGLLPRSRVG